MTGQAVMAGIPGTILPQLCALGLTLRISNLWKPMAGCATA